MGKITDKQAKVLHSCNIVYITPINGKPCRTMSNRTYNIGRKTFDSLIKKEFIEMNSIEYHYKITEAGLNAVADHDLKEYEKTHIKNK